ncbi:glycosyltransferase family 2 protein [Pseudanabaena sp. FACHB-1998]|uniref:glycosyltransferase n=1 Tax=Pseudanabaena sp. FACHB-1998 TaxID=2692858 RepID=UPI001680A7D1|nr:glycosyltransferase family 2 protein [Pseudanabaena sp. FACHB-1998]
MAYLSIILVNYNGSKFLYSCLSSIEKFLNSYNCEVIIIDNFSTDNSNQIVKDNFPSFKLICSKTNLGFGKANNLAVRESKGDYLLFLNTDTVLNENTPQTLLEYLQSNPNIGTISPKITFEDGRYQLSCGNLPSLTRECLDKIKYSLDNHYHSVLSKFYDRQYSKVQEVGWVTGACLMMRRDVFEQIGGFDENFFMYFEDKDLCKRVKELGYKVVYYPHTTIIHLLGGSSHGIKKSVNTYYRNSQLYYYQKHLGKVQTFLLRLYLNLTGKI